MKSFTKQETKIISWVLAFILVAGFFNFKKSLARSRDYQRIRDVGDVVSALEVYHEDFGFYPPSTDDGKIVACEKEDAKKLSELIGVPLDEALKQVFSECQWGQDSLKDLSDDTYPPYLDKLPIDPQSKNGVSYYYVSTVDHFQLFASLELSDNEQYKTDVLQRNLKCGSRVCNFGKSLYPTPLDVSLEEYEQTLEINE